ncbi:MAG: hypothetical protein MUF50_04295 [Planctomycetes bacterium]|jgi:hypothetical protein|nr:hypothetical protein [Planctomycetota bacterium]
MQSEETKKLFLELEGEEETENELIWLYKTFLDLGVENCFDESQRVNFRKGMEILYTESKAHKEIIRSIKEKIINQ